MKLKSIPTLYKGTQFKSRLEADMALVLDRLEIKWEYEPQSFLLPSGTHYWPDFYLPELKTYIETKGIVTPQVEEVMKEFSILIKGVIILIGRGVMVFYDGEEGGGYGKQQVQLNICSKCKKVCFTGMAGSYACRACNYHDGDHDVHELYDENEGINSLKVYVGIEI